MHIYNRVFAIPVLLLIFSTYTDIRTQKIKNYTTYPMILTGLLASFYFLGLKGLLISLLSMILAGLLTAFMPGVSTGGGDIKLAAACGAWICSIYIVLQFFFITLLLSIMVFLVVTIYKQGIKPVLIQLKNEFITLLFDLPVQGVKIFTPYYSKQLNKKIPKFKYESIPMAPFIFIAYLVVSFY